MASHWNRKTSQGRKASRVYIAKFGRAMMLGKKAIKDGQLLRDIAWSRAHLRVLATWLKNDENKKNCKVEWLESYEKIAMRFPVPAQM